MQEANVAVYRAAQNLNMVSRRIEHFKVHPPRFLRVTDLKTTFIRQIKREGSRFQAGAEGDGFYRQQHNSAKSLCSWTKGLDCLGRCFQEHFILVVRRTLHQITKYQPQIRSE